MATWRQWAHSQKLNIVSPVLHLRLLGINSEDSGDFKYENLSLSFLNHVLIIHLKNAEPSAAIWGFQPFKLLKH